MEVKDIIGYIPTEKFREQNDWLFVANAFKAAGLSESDFDEWCERDPEKYDYDVINRYRSLSPRESTEHAENRLLKIAGDNGYTYKGKFRSLPTVVPKPFFRSINRGNSERMPIFEPLKARQDTIRLLALLNTDFIVANYIKEDSDGKCRIRPQQEKSRNLSLAELKADDRIFQELETLKHGCCFLLNRIDEEKLQNDREAGTAKGVKIEHFQSYDWCLLEADEGTIERQWSKILSLDLPVLAIVHSGNKSLHCFCHVGAKSLEEYKIRTEMLIQYCLNNGFNVDTATKNINRWVRFPYAARDGKMQYPVKVNDTYKTFNQWRKDAVYHIDIFDRTVIRASKDSEDMPELKIELNIASMIKLLNENGFRRNNAGNAFFKVNAKVVTKVTEGEIQTFLYDWLKSHYPEDLNVLAHCKWEPTRLKILNSIPDERHTDNATECFFYFSDSAVKVSATAIEKVSYPELEGYIDTKQVIDHDLTFSADEGDFSKFVALICNNESERIKALMSALGYLMHRYKSPSLVKAIILTDESLTNENGGTGKGLLFQALGKMRFCLSADMKTRERNRFFFSTVTKGCSVFHMDDVQENFDFNFLFNVLATDMEIEAKGTNRTVIPFDVAPKIYISTNFAFKDMQKDSYKRRMAVYELFRKFNAHYQPKDEFGRNFFCDWDQKEWNRFYNFMLRCSLVYMREGLLEHEAKFVKEKALRAEFNGKEEFLEFIQSWENDGLFGVKITNDDFANRWLDEKGSAGSTIALKKLLNRYCDLQGYILASSRDAKMRGFIITKPSELA